MCLSYNIPLDFTVMLYCSVGGGGGGWGDCGVEGWEGGGGGGLLFVVFFDVYQNICFFYNLHISSNLFVIFVHGFCLWCAICQYLYSIV